MWNYNAPQGWEAIDAPLTLRSTVLSTGVEYFTTQSYPQEIALMWISCLLYTSDAADE